MIIHLKKNEFDHDCRWFWIYGRFSLVDSAISTNIQGIKNKMCERSILSFHGVKYAWSFLYDYIWRIEQRLSVIYTNKH